MKLNINLDFLSRVTNKDRSLIARQLATMLSSGLAIDQSFKILNAQNKNPVLRKGFNYIITDLQQGNSLSMALSRQQKIFDPVFIAIVRSGENTGKLDKVLEQLADRLEMTDDFNNKVKGAMYYPAFVLGTMIVILILMMVYIIPQLKSVFADIGAELPWTTRTIMKMSDITVKYWWAEIIIVIAIGLAFYYFIRSKSGGSKWDLLKIKIPVLKDLFVLIYMSRFCQTMSMLIQAGLPIIETLAISADVIQNQAYSDSLRNISSQVERGVPISVPMSHDPKFPIMVSQMVLVGEQTGKMSLVLEKLSQYYTRETDSRIKALSGLIEPVLIVIIGLGVAFIVFSIIWPIYSIAQTGF